MAAPKDNPPVEIPKRPSVPARLLHSVAEAAELLSISEKMVRVYVARGELKGIRLGTRLLISQRALEAFASRDHEGVA
jgi:excisionase family DNA binding protein